MNEKVAIEVLRQVKEVFDKHDIEYWLDLGTLLGAIRDDQFIPWDSDIDLSAWKKNKEKILFTLRDLNLRGFKIYNSESMISFRKDDVLICLNMYDLTEGKAIWKVRPSKNYVGKKVCYLKWVMSAWDYSSVCEEASIVTRSLHKILFMIHDTLLESIIFRVMHKLHKIVTYNVIFRVPSHYFKNLSTIKFYGMEFKAPAKTEEYLAYRYGKDWRIPKKDYLFLKEDGSIIK